MLGGDTPSVMSAFTHDSASTDPPYTCVKVQRYGQIEGRMNVWPDSSRNEMHANHIPSYDDWIGVSVRVFDKLCQVIALLHCVECVDMLWRRAACVVLCRTNKCEYGIILRRMN